MWGRTHFTSDGSVAAEVRNLDAAIEWYKEKLGLRYCSTKLPKDEGDAVLGYSSDELIICLVDVSRREPPPEIPVAFEGPKRPPILFTGKLARAHEDLSSRGIDLGPIESDSGGNQFFRFRDLEGNELEVCQET